MTTSTNSVPRTATDLLGNQLTVGSYVVGGGGYKHSLAVYQIIRFTPKMIYLQPLGKNNGKKYLRDNEVAVISDEAATVYALRKGSN